MYSTWRGASGEVPEDPYADRAVYVGFGSQVSAPHVHAAALELLLQAAEGGQPSRGSGGRDHGRGVVI